MWLASLCLLVLSLAPLNSGDSNSDNLFIFPTAPGPSNNFVADLTWTLGSTQNIQWSTSVDSYYIALFQQSIHPASGLQIQTIYTSDSGGTGQQSFSWQVQIFNANASLSPVYFLWLNPGDSQGFTSHYFNITNQAPTSSSSSSSTAFTSSTSSTTSLTASSTSSTPPQGNLATASASPSSVSSSTDAIKVGLGVGLGIGLPLVLIAGIWIGLQAVKQRRSAPHDTGSEIPLSQVPKLEYSPDPDLPPSDPPPKDLVDQANQVYEAPGESHEPHEAPGDGSLIELG